MSKFLGVTIKGDEWPTLINFDYVTRVDPYRLKGKDGVMLTLVGGDTLLVVSDFETMTKLLEAPIAQGT